MPEYRAYNRTRDCYLGIDIVVGEFVHATRRQWLPELRSGSGIGLWMKPFRGINPGEAQILIDLLYLDEDCRVIEAVELFPTFCVSPFSALVASVLVLPSRSINSSQTKQGDQLIICSPEEMAGRLKQFPLAEADAGKRIAGISSATENPVFFGEALPVIDSSDQTPLDDRLREQDDHKRYSPKQELHAEPGREGSAGKRSWLDRWLYPDPPDPRKAPRQPAPGITASFWTECSPNVFEIRDLSATGLYVVTEERWYPGTVIRITLTMPDAKEPHAEPSITVIAKAVRSGNDGVGLEFVL